MMLQCCFKFDDSNVACCKNLNSVKSTRCGGDFAIECSSLFDPQGLD